MVQLLAVMWTLGEPSECHLVNSLLHKSNFCTYVVLAVNKTPPPPPPVAYPGILFGGGVQQIQLRTKNTENGDLGAVAP